jgi:hypothetical protein
MDGLVYSTDDKRVFVIPHDRGYLCPDRKQYRFGNAKFPPDDSDIQVGPLELVRWLD